MTTSPVKDQVRDLVEKEIDNAHKVVDAITSPIAPLDGVVHGVPEGSLRQNVLPTTAVATAEVAVAEETGTVTLVLCIIRVGIKLATPAATTLVGTYLVTRGTRAMSKKCMCTNGNLSLHACNWRMPSKCNI